ncbi:MAG: hypothetical protein EBT07_15905, partial [Actinobacteria bacterium]|nr:hypothetical protein [Actinomycetota bacterium]
MSVLPVGIGPVTGYNIQRSLRFRSSASAYLSRTPAGAGSLTTWTWSGWFKRGALGARQSFFSGGPGGSDTAFTQIVIWDDDKLRIGGWTTNWRITTQVFRDVGAWMHLVVVWDTGNATAADKVRVYVNGSRVTAFDTSNSPTNSGINQAAAHAIARDNSDSTKYFDGYLTEINFVNGQALDPSSFGSTNATTGVWQPAGYSGSYGTNGFYLPFTDNSALTSGSNAGLGKDFSGNGNYWNTNNISITSGSTYDSMTDVPT